jgi:DNA-directed RNA polymerase specialized sigma24 family protein
VSRHQRHQWEPPPESTGGLPLFDAPVPYAKGSDTSREAAEAMRVRVEILRKGVHLAYIMAGFEGMTPDECAKLLKVSVLAVRPRCTELKKAGILEPTGERKKNRSGLSASVLRAV